jgi:hypothetical protein
MRKKARRRLSVSELKESGDMATATAVAAPVAAAASTKKAPKQLPAPNSDFYDLYETLNADELATVKRVRAFMESKVAPVITKYWVDDAFPFELLPAVKELGIGGLAMKGYGCAGGSLALLGFVQMEIARTDPSFATFIADAHAMGQPHRRWPFQVPVATSNPRATKCGSPVWPFEL